MKNLTDNNVVQAASIVALAYVASQAALATVRVGQITHAAVKEFRNKDTSQDES